MFISLQSNAPLKAARLESHIVGTHMSSMSKNVDSRAVKVLGPSVTLFLYSLVYDAQKARRKAVHEKGDDIINALFL